MSANSIGWSIRDQMMVIAARSRPYGAITCFEDLAPGDIQVGAEPFDWGENTPAGFSAASVDFPVEVTAGSRQCTIGVSPRDTELEFAVQLLDPQGNLVTARGDLRVRFAGTGRPYRFFVVDDPKPGTWILRLTGPSLGSTRYRVFGFETNPKVRLTHVIERVGEPEEGRFKLRAFLRVPELVPGATVSAWIGTARAQEGVKWTRQPLKEEGEERNQHSNPPFYSTEIETDPARPAIHTVALDAHVGGGHFEIERQRSIVHDGKRKSVRETATVSFPRIRRRDIFTFFSGPSAPLPGGLVPGYHPKPPPNPDNQKQMVDRWKETHLKKK